MGMSVENGVQASDALAQGLRVKVRRGIDQYYLPRIFDHYRRTGTFIVRIGGVAHSAGASQGGHTHRSAASQHSERRLHRSVSILSLFVCLSRLATAGARGMPRLRRTRQGVSNFHVSHAQFVKTVLQKALFGGAQITLSLFRKQAQSVDGLPRADNV